MQSEFFTATSFLPAASAPEPAQRGTMRRNLNQFFLAAWAAELLYDARFTHLGPKDLLWEPAAGEGHMLQAVPFHVPAFGSEIDPKRAETCRRLTGRPVICGDLTDIALPDGITAVFGNISWKLHLLDALIDRCQVILREGQHCALVAPAWHFQTPKHVLRWNRHFTLEQEALPRALFPKLQHPLAFLIFTRSATPRLIGFRLFAEFDDVRRMNPADRDALRRPSDGPRSAWLPPVRNAVLRFGGETTVASVYSALEPRSARPSANPWWKEQVRKVLQNERHFTRTGPGRYRVAYSMDCDSTAIGSPSMTANSTTSTVRQ